ncbi:uncharacterized protein LOC123266743 [Cotesia glomerata]|uniref:uncharacterized protein LOC123266743 n=1 Tax=Cotesia glomerata TaxID=32391 RepID=UPI001D01987C|nr:uncharacterized protein LOC123266743 [Cotesia glomerata]
MMTVKIQAGLTTDVVVVVVEVEVEVLLEEVRSSKEVLVANPKNTPNPSRRRSKSKQPHQRMEIKRNHKHDKQKLIFNLSRVRSGEKQRSSRTLFLIGTLDKDFTFFY